MPDRLHEELSKGRPLIGGWCVIPSAFSAEVLGRRGFDWVAVDQQHGFAGSEVIAQMIQGISLSGAAPLVRVAYNHPMVIMKVLDMGAFGVIVPLVNTADEAAAAVAACRYPPLGSRSYGPVRSSPTIGTDTDFANSRVLCFAMIETADGYANLEDICATPGLDGIFIGPDDLRLSLGAAADDMPAIFDTILKACESHGILPGTHSSGGDAAKAFAEQGFRLIAIASDADFLAFSAEAELARATGEARVARGSTEDTVVQSVVWAGV